MKNKNILVVTLLSISFLMTGCNSIKSLMGDKKAANMNQTTLKKSVVVGKTTKANVEEVLGEPDKIVNANNKEMWIYNNDSENSSISQYQSSIYSAASLVGIDSTITSNVYRAASLSEDVDKAVNKKKINSVTFTFNKKGVVTSWQVL